MCEQGKGIGSEFVGLSLDPAMNMGRISQGGMISAEKPHKAR